MRGLGPRDLLLQLPHLQRLQRRLLDCTPHGAAMHDPVVLVRGGQRLPVQPAACAVIVLSRAGGVQAACRRGSLRVAGLAARPGSDTWHRPPLPRQFSLSLVVKESFKLYKAVSESVINLADAFFEMDYHDAGEGVVAWA